MTTNASEAILRDLYPAYGVEVPEEPAPGEPQPDQDDPFAQFITGGSFILDVPEKTPAVWGRDGDVLWAEGEALIVCGPNGVGKTTIAGQLLAGRLGLMTTVLGLPVQAGTGRVLYLAMDRPQQAARALRRLFTPESRPVLDERLVVWKGPPPKDLAQNPALLAQMCAHAGADTVVVDSLKDAALKLSEDEAGAGWNRARQAAITQGVQVLELHHPRKSGSDGAGTPTLDSVYGSAWITAGAGSVVFLSGSAGDPVVKLTHLKQPSEEVGPFQILHDHDTGTSALYDSTDLLALVLATPGGMTAKQAASDVYDTENTKPAEVQKVRRRLEKYVKDGLLERVGDPNSKTAPVEYRAPSVAGGAR
ncbi:AAA family ATPase [Nocardiopsis alba]|uniref:AAA family ATPase n=1 Tax=Nocardiopsis alba TaxID=53437 RepID=UPI00366D8BD7